MDKIGVAIALVVMFVALVSANNIGHRGRYYHHQEDQFEHEQGEHRDHGYHGAIRSKYPQDSDFELEGSHHHSSGHNENELEQPYGGHYQDQYRQSHGISKSQLLKRRKIAAKKALLRGDVHSGSNSHHSGTKSSIKGDKHGLRHGSSHNDGSHQGESHDDGLSHQGDSHRGSIRTGGFRHEGGGRHESEFEPHGRTDTRLGAHRGVEGHKGIGTRKDTHGDLSNNDSNENEEVHRHKAPNKDRVIVSEKNRVHEDTDELRRHKDHSIQANIGTSGGKFTVGGAANVDKELEKDVEGGVHSEKSGDAPSSFGIGSRF